MAVHLFELEELGLGTFESREDLEEELGAGENLGALEGDYLEEKLDALEGAGEKLGPGEKFGALAGPIRLVTPSPASAIMHRGLKYSPEKFC